MPKMSSEFGQAVRTAREEAGLTLREVAHKAGLLGYPLSFTTVRDMEMGVVTGPEKVLGLALTVGVPPDRLLRRAGYPLRYDPSVLDESPENDRRAVTRGRAPRELAVA
jgi:transcriptional regulator with XRE-family HTH domain